MKYLSAIICLSILLSGCSLINEQGKQQDHVNSFTPHRVAHAGGGINNKTYTNSYEALNSNIEKGFHYFELDFTFTKDNQLVCLHDWNHSFKHFFGFETKERLTLREFEWLNSRSEFNHCTLEGLSDWMKKNPAAYIVTDVKDNNIKALKIMLQTLPDARTRLIPQMYKPKNLSKVKKLGFDQMVWALYRVSISNEEVVKWVKKHKGNMAIAMPEERARSSLPKKLARMSVPSYVHTINSPEKSREYMNTFGVTEIYTDFLQP